MAALPPFIARYEIKQRLGQGGMGAIYLARDPLIDRLVALKLLHNDVASDDIRKRFAQEARASGALTHPNIVTIHDFGEFEDSPYIVMEYLRGETLAELIRRGSETPITQKLRWIEQVCSALGYAHGENVIHRDVKPSNLMVDQHGIVKVLDFGIARILGAGLTKMSMVIGTPGYMSPEQIQGGTIDARSDIFAVGAVMYELLSYREAFSAETPHAIMSKVVGADPLPLRQFLTGADLSIADVVDRALQKKPEARYSSMTALEVAVRMARLALESQKTELSVVPRGRPISPSSRRRRTDPVEIARRRAEQIEQHLRDARHARDLDEVDAAAAACEAVLLLDPANAPALAILDEIRPETAVARPAPPPTPAQPPIEAMPPTPPAIAPPAENSPSRARQPARTPRPVQVVPPQATRWDDTIVLTPTASHPTTPPKRSPFVWIGAAVAVVVLAYAGWFAGARSSHWSRPFLGPESVNAQPQPPNRQQPSAMAPAPSPSGEGNPNLAPGPVRTPEPPLNQPAPGAGPVEPPEQLKPPEERPAPPPQPRVADPSVELRLGEAAEARGDVIEAIRHYREVRKIDPENATATRRIRVLQVGVYVARAESLLEARDYDGAQAAATSAINVDPGDPSALAIQQKIEQARQADVRRRPPG